MLSKSVTIREIRQDVARYLVSRGCRTDILMATALGDVNLVRHHLDTDPACIRMSVSGSVVSKERPSRRRHNLHLDAGGKSNRARGRGAISAARRMVFELLMERTPEDLKLALACELGDESTFQDYLARNPDATKTLSDAERQKLPAAAQSNNAKAVQLMLEAGWPSQYSGRNGSHSAAWWAIGFHVSNAEMTRGHIALSPGSLKLNRGSMRELRCHAALLRFWKRLPSEHRRFRGNGARAS